MEVYEAITGARMHTAYTRPIYFNRLISILPLQRLLNIIKLLPVTITEVTSVLNVNKV